MYEFIYTVNQSVETIREDASGSDKEMDKAEVILVIPRHRTGHQCLQEIGRNKIRGGKSPIAMFRFVDYVVLLAESESDKKELLLSDCYEKELAKISHEKELTHD